MEFQIKLDKETTSIENFKLLLEKYQGYKACLRDIKINTVLDQKCLFEIDDINPPLFCDFSEEMITSLSESACKINKLTFIISPKGIIEEFSLNISPTNSKMGKLVDTLLNMGINLEVCPKIARETDWQILGFFIKAKY